MYEPTETLFGNVAELCLLYIANYGEGHINGIAKTFGVRPNAVQRQLEKLEAAGILVNRRIGNIKAFSINPRFACRTELMDLLQKALTCLSEEETEQYFRQRRRPRRTGKEL
jgi:DNA-binding MarR family transcriptional regulator